jgi:hypothetical protein
MRVGARRKIREVPVVVSLVALMTLVQVLVHDVGASARS